MGNREVLEQVERGYRMTKPSLIPETMYEMLEKCWDSNANSRPTFEFLYTYFDDFFVTTEPNYKETSAY